MIDSKVTLHEIFYDISTNFFYVLTPCFSPLACVMLRT